MNVKINLAAVQNCRLVHREETPPEAGMRFDWVRDEFGFFKLGECWHHMEEFTDSVGDFLCVATSATTGVARFHYADEGDYILAFNYSV